MSILGIYYLLVVVAAATAIVAVALGLRERMTAWVVSILLLFVLGGIWEEIALRTFTAREPDGMEGLIIRPTPDPGYDHDFTENGLRYAKFAFLVPGATMASVALLVVSAASASNVRIAAVTAAWLAFVGGCLALCLFFLARLLAASEIFI